MSFSRMSLFALGAFALSTLGAQAADQKPTPTEEQADYALLCLEGRDTTERLPELLQRATEILKADPNVVRVPNAEPKVGSPQVFIVKKPVKTFTQHPRLGSDGIMRFCVNVVSEAAIVTQE